jgi:hypothetical protein
LQDYFKTVILAVSAFVDKNPGTILDNKDDPIGPKIVGFASADMTKLPLP